MNQDRPDITVLKTTPLWLKFEEKTNGQHETIAKIETLVKEADELLERVIETFPTYTIHNGIHQLNIIRIMGELLGEDVDKLTSLECAILILSAYFHDIGMVFSSEEKNNLKNEPEFETFLREFPAAYILMYNKSELPIEIAEWYCRWSHARRVRQILINIGDSKLKWNLISLREALGNVCESHNLDIEILKDENKFSSSYLGDADLKFCSIILRLSDILDFDRSRSPEPVYKYLNLDKRDTSRIKESDIEWRKHLCSEGFKFPLENNELKFVAGPDHPAVEHDVREFIDIIDSELSKCKNLLKFCSKRWQDFKIPEKINRTNIIGQGYKYGNFKFTLDQEKILELLMGENLYENRFTFIRELLQNSIDTSRYRKFHEHSNGNISYNSRPIRITDWTDNDGYKWIRIDDYGMGIDEYKIVNYLLKVGNSYYNSSEFQVDKLLYKDKLDEDFTPISRFGIGLLSCFIVGDKVEINTKPIVRKSSEANIRLSIEGLHNYYIMQTGNDVPLPMPNGKKADEGYRSEFGTSIAVRINPSKEYEDFKIEELLLDQVYASEVEIFYNDKGINNDSIDIVAKPTYEYLQEQLMDNEIVKLDEFIEDKIGDKISIEIIPIDLTKYSTSKYLMGQILLINLNVPSQYQKRHNNIEIGITEKLSLRANKKVIISDSTSRNEVLDIPLERLWKKVSCFVDYKVYDNFYVINDLKISHNGIRVPIFKTDPYKNQNDYKLSFNNSMFSNNIYGNAHYPDFTFLFGQIALKDKLRPLITTSRDQLKPLGWGILSNVCLSFLKAFSNSQYCSKIELKSAFVLDDYFDFENVNLNSFLIDDLFNTDDGWKSVKLIKIDGQKKSVSDIIEHLDDGEIKFYKDYYFIGGLDNLIVDALLQINFNLALKKEDKFVSKIIKSKRNEPLVEGLKIFYPLEFIPYENMDYLVYDDYPINLNHELSQWFIKNALELRNKYFGIFQSLIKLLRYINSFYYLRETDKQTLLDINKVLNRIRELNDPNIIFPKNIIISEEDIFSTPKET